MQHLKVINKLVEISLNVLDLVLVSYNPEKTQEL